MTSAKKYGNILPNAKFFVDVMDIILNLGLCSSKV